MKSYRLIFVLLFLIIFLTGCKHSTEKTDVFTSANDDDNQTNDFINIKVSTPISLGVGIIDNINGNYILLLQLYEGIYKEHYFFGPDFGSSWIGKYRLAIIDVINNRLVNTYEMEEWGEPLCFHGKLDLTLEDYNEDGNLDVLIGQHGSSNFKFYRMYYITKDLGIGYYNKIGEIIMSDQSLSPSMKRGQDGALEYYYYDNSKGEEIQKKIDMELLTVISE